MSRNSTLVEPSEVVIFEAAGVTIKAKLLVDGSVSLVRTTAYDSGSSRFFDVPPGALAGLALVIADGLARGVLRAATPRRPGGMEPDVHEALLAASGQSDSAGKVN